MMTDPQIREFTSRWLPAWTGNKPEKLADFYDEKAFYMDPGVPDGIRGKEKLRAYFRKLLAQNPEWTWTLLECFPLEQGFLNKWHALIPLGEKTLTFVGLGIVYVNTSELIQRHEVYFDRTNLLIEMLKRRGKRAKT